MLRIRTDLSRIVDAGGRPFSGGALGLRGWTFRLIAVLVAVLLAGAALAACATGPSTSPAGSIRSVPPSATPGASVTSAGFPITLTDDEGTGVTIATRPRRIVSLTPGTTEILFALGAGDRVVGSDSASDYPSAAGTLPHVAEFGKVDAERLVGLGADLVVAGGNGYTPADGIARLRSLGLPVLVVYASTVRGVFADVELLGRAIGSPDAGAELASSMSADIDSLSQAVAGRSRPRVFYEIDATKEIFGPADDSFLTEMIVLAGGVPITSGSADSFQIALERLIAADPQVIVLGDAAFGATPNVVRQRPGWSVMTAVGAGAIRTADDKLVTRPGPRLAEGLRSLILAIHPDAQLP